MGRKPIEDKRTQFNRYVAGATPPLVKNLALQLGISEGEVIDRAIQTLAICESFGAESIRKTDSDPVVFGDSSGVLVRRSEVVEGDHTRPGTFTVKPKFVPPTNLRHQRRTK